MPQSSIRLRMIASGIRGSRNFAHDNVKTARLRFEAFAVRHANKGLTDMWKEFREFALKGNVVDLAIGVIIGGAFGTIVASLVGDIIMPLIGALGSVDFSNYFLPLNAAVTEQTLEEA
jgi:hypothetical protein